MSLHYKFGGSTAGRTVECPSWHNLAINMPGGPASMAALEGTLMHLMFEAGVEDRDFEPGIMEGETRDIEGKTLTVTPVHVEKVYTALDCLDDIVEKYHYDIVEPEVMMNTDDETGGTADIIAMELSAHHFVVKFGVHDLKTGDGHMVWAEDNKQLLFYAWQAVEKYKQDYKFTDDTQFQLGIIQPSERRDDPVDIWETDLKTIMAFARTYKRAQKIAKSGVSEPCAGPHCAYCPAEATCPAKTGLVSQALRIPQDSVEMAALVKGLSLVDEAEAWCRAIRKTAHEQAEAGVKLKGFKLVNKRATRKWDSEVEANAVFKRMHKFKLEDYMAMQMKTAPQMEKVCKSKGVDFKQFESMISLHSSGTTLVKDTDKRPEALALPALADMASRLK